MSQNTHSLRTIAMAVLVLSCWCGAAITLALLGVYQGSRTQTPTIEFGILIPILVGAVAIWRSARVGQMIDGIPQHWLVGVQVFRLVGIVFLVLYASGQLPGIFALPAGIGDALVGIMAPIIAIRIANNASGSANLVRAWNWFGILDLIVAVSTGFLTSPSPLQLFSFDLPNYLISKFPLVLIPTFLVPLAILLHIASLVKLNRSESVAEGSKEAGWKPALHRRV
jgi:hypothetical protein